MTPSTANGYSQILDANSVIELFGNFGEDSEPSPLAVESCLSFLASYCECSVDSLRQEFSRSTPGQKLDSTRLGISVLQLVEFRPAVAAGVLERYQPDADVLLALLRLVPECRKQVFVRLNLSELSKAQLMEGIAACKSYQRAFEAELWTRNPTLEEIEYLERLDHDDETLFFGGGGDTAYLPSS